MGTQVKGLSAWQVRKSDWMVALEDWVLKVIRHTKNNRIDMIKSDYRLQVEKQKELLSRSTPRLVSVMPFY